MYAPSAAAAIARRHENNAWHILRFGQNCIILQPLCPRGRPRRQAVGMGARHRNATAGPVSQPARWRDEAEIIFYKRCADTNPGAGHNRNTARPGLPNRPFQGMKTAVWQHETGRNATHWHPGRKAGKAIAAKKNYTTGRQPRRE